MIDKSISGLPTISASKINVYRTCAKQYYYKYILPYNSRPQDDKNVAALLGTALHRAIELKYREGKNPSLVFQDVMNDTITEWENKHYKINAAGYYSTALKVGKDIIKSFDWNRFDPIELEYAFTLPFPNPQNPLVNITGYIDLIDRDGIVVDHKSASVAPNQDELNHNPQFILYAWAYEQLYGTRPTGIIWNHLRTARLYEANIYERYEDKIAQLTNDIIAMLENEHHARRKIDKVCKSECSFFTLCYGEKSKVVIEDE